MGVWRPLADYRPVNVAGTEHVYRAARSLPPQLAEVFARHRLFPHQRLPGGVRLAHRQERVRFPPPGGRQLRQLSDEAARGGSQG